METGVMTFVAHCTVRQKWQIKKLWSGLYKTHVYSQQIQKYSQIHDAWVASYSDILTTSKLRVGEARLFANEGGVK